MKLSDRTRIADEPIDIKCPTCKAKEGERCHVVNGRFHEARVALVNNQYEPLTFANDPYYMGGGVLPK